MASRATRFSGRSSTSRILALSVTAATLLVRLPGPPCRGRPVLPARVTGPARPLVIAPTLPAQPDAQNPQQVLDLDRLGDVVRRARGQRLLPVAAHRLGGQRDDRQRGELRPGPDLGGG